MSRLTDLRTIARGIAAPLAWSRLAVVPKVSMHIWAAEHIVYNLIHREEEAVERERVVEERYKVDMAYWHSIEPVKPWREDAEYDAAMRTWRAGEPTKPLP